MQKMYPRTNPGPAGPSANSNVIPAAQIEEALRDSVHRNAAYFGPGPENADQGLTDVNSLVQRVVDFCWTSWMTRLWTSGRYEIFCTMRAKEYKRKSLAICSSTTLQSAQQKVLSITSVMEIAAHSTVLFPERGDFVGSEIPPPQSSTVAIDVFIPPK